MFGIFNKPHADPTALPMAVSPWPITIIVTAYLLFVLKLGRQYMSKRAAFQLRGILQVYNVVQIIFNALLFIAVAYEVFVLRPYKLSCMTVLPMDHALKHFDRLIAYAYYINKVLDLLDTIFIVLRKSYKQISVLHLVHHVYMASFSYICIRLHGYGGHLIITTLFNVMVHVLMYSYYYLCAQNPQFKQSIGWKKYITLVQMAQLLTIFGHSAWTAMQPDCEVSRYVIWLVLVMSMAIFLMFTNFYMHAYILPKRKPL
ncbi:CG31141, partial [Drosophila busckii]